MVAAWAKNSSFFWTLFLTWKEGKYWITVMQGWTSRKHFRNTLGTLQVVSFHVLFNQMTFQHPKMHPWKVRCHFWHTCAHPVMSLAQKQSSGRAHPHLHYVQVWSKLDQQFWDTAIFVSSPLFSLIWPLSDHPVSETWPQNQPHNNSSLSLPRPKQMPLVACWLPELHPSAYPYLTGTWKMHTTLSPYIWHTLENWLLLNHITPYSEDHLWYIFVALGTKSLKMHAQWMPTGSKEEQRVTKAKDSAFLDRIHQGMTHDVNTHVCLRELKRCCGQARRGPPRSCCMHKDPDGPLWDDQWQALWAWATLLYCLCLLPWGKAPWETYGKTIQDTPLWASWHRCDPLCHSECPGTSLPQLQTYGHNLPWQASSSPHQPQ